MKPLRLHLRIRNNRLIRAREQLGLRCAEAAKLMGVSYNTLIRLESCSESPLLSPTVGRYNIPRTDGKVWRVPCLNIAEFYGFSLEYLWSEDVMAVKKSASVAEASLAEVHALLPDPPRTPFEELASGDEAKRISDVVAHVLGDSRSQVIVRMRSEGATFDEIGLNLNISRERVRQLERRAYKKIRDSELLEELRL